MTHYVILFDGAADSRECDIEVVAVTHTFDEAMSVFAKRVSNEKQYAFDHGYDILTDTDTEFDAGESCFYAGEHTHLYIEIVNDESEIILDLAEDAVSRDTEDCPYTSIDDPFELFSLELSYESEDESEIVRDLSEDAVNKDIDDCPFGGDISDDCADCAYGEDYHYSDSECKEREDK